jgi:hypothetical protein
MAIIGVCIFLVTWKTTKFFDAKNGSCWIAPHFPVKNTEKGSIFFCHTLQHICATYLRVCTPFQKLISVKCMMYIVYVIILQEIEALKRSSKKRDSK